MTKNKKGFAGLTLIVILTLVVAVGAVYVYKQNKISVNGNEISKNTSLDANQPVDAPVGLWKLEKAYTFDNVKKQFVEISNLSLYMEYTKDGKWCSQWQDENSTKCNGYDTYTFDKDIIKQDQVGLTGPEWHYRYKVENGNLTLLLETYDEASKKWSSESIKYVLKPVSR